MKKKIFEKKKKKSNFNFCSCFSFLFYLIFQKLVKSKWVVRQFKSEFQKLVKSWDSILRICNNFAIKRLSPFCDMVHCAPLGPSYAQCSSYYTQSPTSVVLTDRKRTAQILRAKTLRVFRQS